MDLSPDAWMTIAAQVAVGVGAILGRRAARPALPAHEERAPSGECACAGLDDERIKKLVRQAMYDHMEQADRSHKKLDELDLLAILDERTRTIAIGIESLRSQREQTTPPHGLLR